MKLWIAAQLMDLFEERGVKVPRDISVVGIDDANIAQIRNLSSIPHPKEELGRKAAENLLMMIQDSSFDGEYLFDPQPVLRGSVKQI